jgi:hypothetical protein
MSGDESCIGRFEDDNSRINIVLQLWDEGVDFIDHVDRQNIGGRVVDNNGRYPIDSCSGQFVHVLCSVFFLFARAMSFPLRRKIFQARWF